MDNNLQQQYEFISEITKSEAFFAGDLKGISKVVSKKVSEIVGVQRVGVWLFSPDYDSLSSIVLSDKQKIQRNVVIQSIDFPNYTKALRTKRSIIANNVLENKDCEELIEGYLDKLGVSSMLDSAIRKGDQIIGVLCLEHIGQQRTWSIEEISFAAVISDLLSQTFMLGRINETTADLEQKRLELEESNIALKNLLTRFEDEKTATKENIATNIEKNILPIIVELKKNPNVRSELIEQLEDGVKNLSSGFYQKLAKFKVNLSPSEVKVCHLISAGYQGKQIADLLKISFSTVETHKKNIRKKLNITGKSVNLKVFLDDLSL